jgi:hypothetical protein
MSYSKEPRTFTLMTLPYEFEMATSSFEGNETAPQMLALPSPSARFIAQ